jgi:hypothetical protein
MLSPAPAAVVQARSPLRVVAASFVAGVAAMLLCGLAAPVIAKAGLSVAEAQATTSTGVEVAIAPLDLQAVRAQLALADATLRQSAAATDHTVARLERLANQ